MSETLFIVVDQTCLSAAMPAKAYRASPWQHQWDRHDGNSLCNLFGVKVIVTAGSDDKVAAARAHSVDHAINYKAEDFVARVLRT